MYERDGEILDNYLEADQLWSETSRPLPRARLGRAATAGLWALRVFAIVLSAMVIYVFFSQLGG